MDLETALQELRIKADATEDEVREAYATRLHAGGHPDTGGDRERFERLLSAYQTVRRLRGFDTSGSTELVAATSEAVVRQRAAELELERLGSKQRALRRDEARDAVDAIVAVHVGPLKRARRRNLWLSGVGVILGAVTLLLRGTGGLYGASPSTDTFIVGGSLAVAAVGLAFGVAAAITSVRVQALENAMEDVSFALGRRQAFVRVLRAIGRSSPPGLDLNGAIPEDELHAAFEAWIRDQAYGTWLARLRRLLRPQRRRDKATSLAELARRIGSEDFMLVFVAKGKEVEVLREDERLTADRDLELIYHVDVSPGMAKGSR